MPSAHPSSCAYLLQPRGSFFSFVLCIYSRCFGYYGPCVIVLCIALILSTTLLCHWSVGRGRGETPKTLSILSFSFEVQVMQQHPRTISYMTSRHPEIHAFSAIIIIIHRSCSCSVFNCKIRHPHARNRLETVHFKFFTNFLLFCITWWVLFFIFMICHFLQTTRQHAVGGTHWNCYFWGRCRNRCNATAAVYRVL